MQCLTRGTLLQRILDVRLKQNVDLFEMMVMRERFSLPNHLILCMRRKNITFVNSVYINMNRMIVAYYPELKVTIKRIPKECFFS